MFLIASGCSSRVEDGGASEGSDSVVATVDQKTEALSTVLHEAIPGAHMMIRVESEEAVTLIDPLERIDSLSLDYATQDIPNCNRLSGVGELMSDGKPPPTTVFEIGYVIEGDYLLRAKAEAAVPLFVQATVLFDSGKGCDDSDDQVAREGEVRAWKISCRSTPTPDSCTVTISRLN